jgi:ribose 5-phosphate isomerase B
MKIAIGSDHGGFELKQALIPFLQGRDIEVADAGTYTTDSVDYPEFAEAVALLVVHGEADAGIVICGTGIGISIAANKVPGIRAALVTSPQMAELAKQHNNANMSLPWVAVSWQWKQQKPVWQPGWMRPMKATVTSVVLDKIAEIEKKAVSNVC